MCLRGATLFLKAPDAVQATKQIWQGICRSRKQIAYYLSCLLVVSPPANRLPLTQAAALCPTTPSPLTDGVTTYTSAAAVALVGRGCSCRSVHPLSALDPSPLSHCGLDRCVKRSPALLPGRLTTLLSVQSIRPQRGTNYKYITATSLSCAVCDLLSCCVRASVWRFAVYSV